MLVDWKYIYKRRGWSIQVIVEGLSEKTWDEFQNFHKSKGIVCPPQHLFSAAVKEAAQPVKKVSKEKTPPVSKKRKRTYTKKNGASNDRGKKAKE